MIDQNQKDLLTQAHCFTADLEQRCLQNMYQERDRPFHHMKPKLFIDGDQWCALYGENLQEGLAGFGDSPAEASADFDKAYFAKLPRTTK